MAGIYIHIPFCKKRCIYCDFYSSTKQEYVEKYIDALICEAKLRPASDNISTLYIGGGTPSQLNIGQFKKLIDGLNSAYDLSRLEEFTVEVNPDDVSIQYIQALKQLGVNRISMGVQSFVDSELQFINRRHNATEAINAVNAIYDAGIENISIDLIYGIPGQTLESWKESIRVAMSLNVQHISAYNLSYEEGTTLWRLRESGKLTEVEDSQCIKMYNIFNAELKQHGYDHYEISNYCKPGFYSRHNSSYWNNTPYIGLGASAHSFDGTHRGYNPASISDYINTLSNGEIALIVEESEWWEKYDETVMISLRTAHGLDIEVIRKRFGEKAVKHFVAESEKYLADGSLRVENGVYSIPEECFMISDGIIRDLMW